MARTAQQILAERRANIRESMRETDATAKSLLDFHTRQLDAELAALESNTLEVVAAKRVILAAHADTFGHAPGNEFDLDAAARAFVTTA